MYASLCALELTWSDETLKLERAGELGHRISISRSPKPTTDFGPGYLSADS
uniref:Uncharacterized protein n=1 Tax=Arundo donax TaxID=35708 RepID=A0A0A8Y1Z8_ARUDO